MLLFSGAELLQVLIWRPDYKLSTGRSPVQSAGSGSSALSKALYSHCLVPQKDLKPLVPCSGGLLGYTPCSFWAWAIASQVNSLFMPENCILFLRAIRHWSPGRLLISSLLSKWPAKIKIQLYKFCWTTCCLLFATDDICFQIVFIVLGVNMRSWHHSVVTP